MTISIVKTTSFQGLNMSDYGNIEIASVNVYLG